MKHPRRHALAVAVVCLFAPSGCAKDRIEPATQIIVIVDHTFEPRRALTGVEFVVEPEDGDGEPPAHRQAFDVVERNPERGRELVLPAAVTLVPPARGAAAPFRLTVIGYGRDAASGELEWVRHTAILAFKAGTTLRATFLLAAGCAMQRCPKQTCYADGASAQAGECRPIRRPELPEIPPPASDDPPDRVGLFPDEPPWNGDRAGHEAPEPPPSVSESDPCVPNPCENGGKCVRQGGDALCSCAGTGFEGKLCDRAIDECAQDHGGCARVAHCIDGPRAARCKCPDTHWGDGVGAQGCETRVTQLAARASHTCALLVNGEVKCWGKNPRGQLGDGTYMAHSEPVLVQGLRNVIQVSVGDEHSCAITRERAVQCWGGNETGQLGDDTTTARLMPVPLAGDLLVEDIATGANHNCVRQGAAEVWCWGWNFYGQLADSSRKNRLSPSKIDYTSDGARSNAQHLGAGELFSCVGHVQGVDCWGQYTKSDPQPTGPTRMLDEEVSSLAAGRRHACVTTKAGQVQCWGDLSAQSGSQVNDRGIASVDLGATEAIGVAIGEFYACAALRDGRVRCWEVSASGGVEPQPVPGLTDVRQVVVGLNHGCVLLKDGSVRCWELTSGDANLDPPAALHGF